MKHETDIDALSLRCLVATVRERSVTRAAHAVGMAQPALSHVLARLRRRFGDPLLVRGNGGMTATPRALELAAAAADVLSEMQRLHTPDSFDPAREESRFVVTVTDYLERLLAPALVQRLLTEAPGVCVEWRTPNAAMAREWLENGEVDLRLAWVHAPWHGLRFTRLASDRLVCLAREGHPGVGRRLTLAQFMAASHVRPAIAVTSGKARRLPPLLTLEQYLGVPETAAGYVPARKPVNGAGATWHALRHAEVRVGVLAQSFLAIPRLVVQSDLIATVPDLVLRGEHRVEGLRVLAPPLELPALQGALYWHERANGDARHRWFRRLVAAVARVVLA